MADLSNFMPDMQLIRQNQLNYDVMKQAQAEQEQAKQGFSDAYKHRLNAFSKPQESQLGELGQRLIGESEGERALAPRESWKPPADASYGYLQGAEQANAMFQQRQLDYLNRSVMPIIKMAHDTNNNEIRDKLLAQLPQMESDPDAQLAVSYLKSIKNADFSHPGETRGITVTEDNIGTLAKGDPVQMEKLKPYLGKTVDYSDQGGVIFKIGPSSASSKAPKTITVPTDEEGTMGTFEYKDGEWVEVASGKKMSAGGAGGGGAFRPYTGMPGYFYNTRVPGLFKVDESGNFERTNKTTAPGDIRQEMMDFSFSKSPKNRAAYEVAKSLPTLIDQVVESGKKLDYSDTQFLGKVEKWKNGQLNDPQFIDYMVKRNDALLELVQVLRNGGITDQAHKAEMEISNPTMSPKALEAWGKAQKEALAVRTNRFAPIFDKEPKGQQNKPKNTERLSATISYLKKKFPGRTEEEYRKAAEASLR
jgi:hypothetical protein